MRNQAIRAPRLRGAGFSLVELAVVMFIIALLLGTAMFSLSAQVETRNFNETQQRLEQARELVLSFAVVNKRLPCPAAAPPDAPFNNATGTGVESPAGGACTDNYTGFLPGASIGFTPVDSHGYALDPWGNRLRYAVSSTAPAGVRFTDQHVASTSAWSIASTPADLIVCSEWGGSTTTCGTANTVVSANVAVAVIWSQGKNFRTLAGNGVQFGSGGTDEAANNKHRLPGVYNNHPVFVQHAPTPSTVANGEFDDQLIWIPVGVLYSRMISAGILP